MLAVSLFLFYFQRKTKANLWLTSWIRPMGSFLLTERDKMSDFALSPVIAKISTHLQGNQYGRLFHDTNVVSSLV
jgi:hypothetical protein